jgi:phage terminase large subunit-like protein
MEARAKAEGWSKWIRTDLDRLAMANGCWFDVDAGERVCYFFSRFLRHSKGQWAGKPFDLIDWQRDDIIMPLFSWKRPGGTRRFREAYIEVPKKNGKSSLCAGLVLYLLVGDDEPGAEVYGAAADRDQASIIFHESASMVAQSPALSKQLRVIPTTKSIVFDKTTSRYKALSADVPTKEGLNIHGLVFDELHAQKSRQLWDTLEYGGAARRQPILIAITTAGKDQEGIGWEQHEYATASLRDPSFTDWAMFAYIAGAEEGDDLHSPETWRRANPSYGITVDSESFQRDHDKAIKSPAKWNSFLRYRLNIWTQEGENWIDMDAWDECRNEIDESLLLGRKCYLGLDLASTTDMTAGSLLFPPSENDPLWRVKVEYWLPEECGQKRERLNRELYERWSEGGFLTLTPGGVTDYGFVHSQVDEWADKYDLQGIGVDPYNATQSINELQAKGYVVVNVRQGIVTLNEPAKRFEKIILGKQIAHDGNPILRWNIANAIVKIDPKDNILPQKPNSRQKIDGLAATLNALCLAIGETQPSSSYDDYEETEVDLVSW